MKREKIEVDMSDEMLLVTSRAMRSTSPSPDHTPTPENATRKLKKNTRFCRDCGRYLNRPCTWPTCGKCNTKHFEHIPCWQARQNLQTRLDTFDRGYGTSQKRKPAKFKALSFTAEPSSQQIEHANKEDTVDIAARLSPAAPPGMTFDLDGNEGMSWSLDSEKSLSLIDAQFPVTTAPKSPERHVHVHPGRQSSFSKPSETADSTSESLTSMIPDGNMPSLDSTDSEAPQFVTYGASVEENVDAFIADVLRDMHSNDNIADAPEHAEVSQRLPSYLDYLRRNLI